MQSKNESRFSKPSPYDRANIFSRFWLTFMLPLMVKAVKNDGLQMDDLYRCSVDDEAKNVMRHLDINWTDEKQKSKPSFARTLFRTYAKDYVLPFAVFTFEELCLQIAQPLLLSRVIRYFSGDSSISYSQACLCAAGVCVCSFVFVLVDRPLILYLRKLGMRLRTACCCFIYRKTLKLSRASLGQTQVGQIVNIMSNDVAQLEDFSITSLYLVVAPIQSTVIIYIVWHYLGLACLAGVVLLFLYIPFQGLMGRLFAKFRLGVATLTDTRLRYMNEIISGMKVIKMYCWERPFEMKVTQARNSEVSTVRNSCFLKAINLATYFVASRLILFVCFVVYVVLGNTLTAEAVFVSMALFNTLRTNMTLMFPNAVTHLSELKVTCQRIQNFLLLEEIEEDAQTNELASNRSASANYEASLKATNITAKWNFNDNQLTLKDISFDLKSGDLLVVIGPVGAGKSSLLMSLLNELRLKSGKIDLNGNISYASQDAWSFNDSVRNNILFGLEYNETIYQKVIEICALQRDLKLLPFGDRTLVGEKGVLLSGGQKARINLARAVYRDADICLFDDPLSAVDTAVAKHIFEKCIMEYLASKICILVTHQIQYIKKATKILILKEGKCLAYGTFEHIQQMGIDFVTLLEERKINQNDHDNTQKERSVSKLSENFPEQTINEMEYDEEKPVKMEEEQHHRGSIQSRIYWEYIRAGGGAFLISFMIILSLLSQSLYHGSDIFLTYWTNKNQAASGHENNGLNESSTRDIVIYSSLIAILFVSAILRSVTFFAICMRASVRLHNKIFTRLLHAPVAFFDSNPSGRILNRFSKDLGVIDEKIPFVAYDFSVLLSQAIGVIITIAIANWILLIPASILVVIVVGLRQVYVKVSRDIKRFEAITRSPIYSHVSTTVDGIVSIRAYRSQNAFEQQFNVFQNDQTSTSFLFLCTSRLLAIVTDFCSALFITICTTVVMLSRDMPGGTAGLIISSGLLLAGSMQFGVRMSAEFENQMTSVERVVEYQSLEQEASAESKKDSKPKEDWPIKGEIEFDHMSLAYGTNVDKPVLKDINCTFHSGEKIGIVGRTGAGKSSMIAALFRLTEPTGAIRIDGVDIQSIGLDDLRKKISIIPQDPVVFSGTVRYNLDPFNEYTDSDMWEALEKVQLKTQVDNFDGKLDAKLSDSGGNLSVGQRQLICLARAILRRNRVLILDEATANVDHQTDGLIQKTIRSEFTTCTVLTIAHRLNTIIDCDRVLVLDAGKIIEFDTPYQLLNSRGGFFEMCKKTGSSIYSHLYRLAKETCHQNNDSEESKTDL